MSDPNMGLAALAVAKRGIPVFPVYEPRDGACSCRRADCDKPGKHPRTFRGALDATTDPQTIGHWFSVWPCANVAAATGPASGFWCLDIDGDEGAASLADLEARHGPLPQTAETITGGGGRHIFFRWPSDGPELRNSCGRVGPRIDVRAAGGSIILPPSLHASGRRYQWRPGTRGLAVAPEWLVNLALPPPEPERAPVKPLTGDVGRYVSAAVASELRRLDAAAPGTRNATLNCAAFALGRFVAGGMLPEDWAAQTLEAHAVGLGLSASEARQTIRSGFRAGMAKPRELVR